MDQTNSLTRCQECGTPTDGPCGHCGATGDDPTRRGAYLPLQYFTDFLRFIARRPDQYRVITYNDLCWSEAETYPSDYRAEYGRWRKRIAKDRHNRNKIHILLQHDIDSRPERTMTLLRHEAEIETPSNSMLFNARIDRKALKHEGRLVETEYDIDHAFLRSLSQSEGFVVGYHCNAFERSGFDEARAQSIFLEDVAALQEPYGPLRFFSPHGGVPAPDGRNNNSITVPPSLQRSMIWVHNRNSAVFDGNYSDGGINNKNRDPELRNLIAFAKTWKPGGRYRILTHPQYFHDVFREAPVLAQSSWYREVLDHYTATPDQSLWEKALG